MSTTRNNLCIIPARGGSKRIPRKNIKDFLGKPIIAYSIEAALESGLFTQVMVSTDDEEIAEVAKKYGAEVPFFRSKKTADDFATLADVVEEVKEFYLKQHREFDNICCVLATAPFINGELIHKVFMEMQERDFDSVRPVIRFSYPPQRGVKMEDGKISFFNPDFASTRSQDLEPVYYDAGMFYWMKFELGLKGINRGGFEISELEAHDIDTLEDWKIAEIKYTLLKKD